jgi:hypothetical protein
VSQVLLLHVLRVLLLHLLPVCRTCCCCLFVDMSCGVFYMVGEALEIVISIVALTVSSGIVGLSCIIRFGSRLIAGQS